MPVNRLIMTGLFALFSLNNQHSGEIPADLPGAGNKYVITHFNITFAPDLSNRVNPGLYKRPLSDVDILKIITHDLYPSILRCKRSENQKDKLLVDFVNKELISEYAVRTDKLLIDFGRFPNQNDRMAYILGRKPVKQTLSQDSGRMVAEFNRTNSLAARKNFGADIWTYLNEGIDNKKVLPTEKPVADEYNTYVSTYRNVLILTTDGYIEGVPDIAAR